MLAERCLLDTEAHSPLPTFEMLRATGGAKPVSIFVNFVFASRLETVESSSHAAEER